MRVSSLKAGESLIFPNLNRAKDDRFNASFTLLGVSWFRSPTVPAVFFHGAMGVTWDGTVAILDFITLEFTLPLLALPAPEKAA